MLCIMYCGLTPIRSSSQRDEEAGYGYTTQSLKRKYTSRASEELAKTSGSQSKSTLDIPADPQH